MSRSKSLAAASVTICLPGRSHITLPTIMGTGLAEAISKAIRADLPNARVTVRQEVHCGRPVSRQALKSHHNVQAQYVLAIRERQAGLGLLRRLNLLPDYLVGAA